mmetsp:Transcript_24828/g.77491  ORF Transcript_24828/g.77491 Transcript_24828/m.77491 type:complete len:531 (+) Transcript_24828:402-1994(+)
MAGNTTGAYVFAPSFARALEEAPALAEALSLRTRLRVQQTCHAMHSLPTLRLLPTSIPSLNELTISRPLPFGTDLAQTIPISPGADTVLLREVYPDARHFHEYVRHEVQRRTILDWVLGDLGDFMNMCNIMTIVFQCLYFCPLFFVIWSAYLPTTRSAGPFGKSAAAGTTYMLYHVPIFANLLQFLISTGLLSEGMNDPRIINGRVVSNAYIIHVLMNFMVLGNYFTQPGLMFQMLCMTACCLQQLVSFRNRNQLLLDNFGVDRDDTMYRVQSEIQDDTVAWLQLFPGGEDVAGRGVDYVGGTIDENGVDFTVLFCCGQRDNLFVNNHFATLEQTVDFTLEIQGAPRSDVLRGLHTVTKTIQTISGRSASSLLPQRACVQPLVVEAEFVLIDVRIGPDEAQWNKLFCSDFDLAGQTKIARSFTDLAQFAGQALVSNELLPPLPGSTIHQSFDHSSVRNLRCSFFGLLSNPMWWAKRVAAHDGFNEPQGDSFVCWLRYNEAMPNLCPDEDDESDASDDGVFSDDDESDASD